MVLLAVLCLATLVRSRGVANHASRRPRLGVVAVVFAAAILSGPWWVFLSWQGIANTDYLPVTFATFQTNLGRLPTIAWMELANLVSAKWAYAWPLAVIFGLIKRRATPRAAGWTTGQTVDLLPTTALLYLAPMGLAYVFSAFVPYQQHIASSVHRLTAHVVALPVLWIAYHGIEER
jgi:hypothetical protein